MSPSKSPFTSSQNVITCQINDLTSELNSKTLRNFQSSRLMARQYSRQYCVQNVMKIGSELTEKSAKLIHPGQ